MATVAAPRKRPRVSRRWLIIGGIVVALIIIGVVISSMMGGGQNTTGQATPGWTTVAAESGTIEAAVSATGNVAAQGQASLSFGTDGKVSEVLVAAGDQVEAGQPLARVVSVDAELQLASAEADLIQAKANYEDLIEGATATEIKDAEAQLAQSKASYDQTLAKVSNADITAARARLEQAQARLNRLQSGPKDTDQREAVAQLETAKTSLQAERDRLSAAKTNAQLALDTAVADLTRAQQNYATAKANWDFVADTNQDPTNPESPNPEKPGDKIPNKLNDTQRQQYYDAFVSAESALRAAEITVSQAKLNYDTARQAEITGVQTAEQSLASAQASYDSLQNGADRDELAEARASVASAQAELNRLIGDSRASDLAAAQANLDAAQLALDRLKGDPEAVEMAQAQAELTRAEVAVKRARHTLEQTTLTAPFAATVAQVDLRIGEQVGQTSVITIVDMGSFHIDVPVDELDVAQIQLKQPVKVILDALPDRELEGVVKTISPLATVSDKGTNTYLVSVELNRADPAVKPGMTATAEIITQSKTGVVLVPRRAVQTENGQSYVLIPSLVPQPQAPPQPGQTPQPGERRPVTLGLSNSEFVEVVSGLKAGEQVYVPDVVQTFNPMIS